MAQKQAKMGNKRQSGTAANFNANKMFSSIKTWRGHMDKSNDTLPTRVDKVLQWLEESRDSWKKKIITSKYELKKQKTAVRRARKSRDLLHEEWPKEKKAHYSKIL